MEVVNHSSINIIIYFQSKIKKKILLKLQTSRKYYQKQQKIKVLKKVNTLENLKNIKEITEITEITDVKIIILP